MSESFVDNVLRTCTKCHKVFPNNDEFFNKKGRQYKDGRGKLKSYCKKCGLLMYEKFLSKNKDQVTNRRKDHYKNNIMEERLRVKRYREEHPWITKEYYAKNKEEIQKRAKEWRLENKDKIQDQNKAYRDSHREEIKKYYEERMKSDPRFRITLALRSRVRSSLRSQNAKKTKHTLDLIGCSINGLKKHLESQFLPGMTWDNYGGKIGWQIDHIRPCATFDLTKEEDQKECFNYKNLRPLWGIDNWKKNSLYNGVYIRRKWIRS